MNEVLSQNPPIEAPGPKLRDTAQQLITGELEQEVSGRLPLYVREIDLQTDAIPVMPGRNDNRYDRDDGGGGERQRAVSRAGRPAGACGNNGRPERRGAGCIFPTQRLEGLLQVVVALDHSPSLSSRLLSSAFPRS